LFNFRILLALALAPALVAGSLVLSASSANAHLGRISYSDIVVEDTTVFYRLKFAAHLIPGTGATMAGHLTRHDILAMEPDIQRWLHRDLRVVTGGRTCTPTIVESMGPDSRDNLTLVLAYQCPEAVESIRIEFHPFDESIEEFENIVSLELGDAKVGYVFSPGEPLLTYGEQNERNGQGTQTAPDTFGRFFDLGLRHIWTGYDHLLFLLALLLPGGSLLRLAGIVSAFTVAHSITLALAFFGIPGLLRHPLLAVNSRRDRDRCKHHLRRGRKFATWCGRPPDCDHIFLRPHSRFRFRRHLAEHGADSRRFANSLVGVQSRRRSRPARGGRRRRLVFPRFVNRAPLARQPDF